MRTVIYSMSVSLDGFIAGPDGAIDFAAPDEELMNFHNEQSRELAAHLTGRRLYEEMLPWETQGQSRSDPRAVEFARIWTGIPKVVFSTTLESVQGNAVLATGGLGDELSRFDGLVSVGGAGLAATAVEQDLIDEYRLFVDPVVVGGGTSFFPGRSERLDLRLEEHRRFGSGVMYLRYVRSR